MLDTYRALPFDYAESYAQFFAKIADGAAPLIVNCSAGKDRTGIAVALLLSVLGVSRRTITGDYAMTERLLAADRERAEGDRAKLYTFPKDAAPGVVNTLMRSDPAYLAAAFAAIEAKHSSVNNFLQAIGVGTEAIAEARNQLLA